MFVLENIIRSSIKALKPYSSARDEFQGIADVYLDANENPFPNGKNRYPDPLQIPLRTAFASIKNVDPTNVVSGNGSDEIIDLLMRVFCNPGIDNIITLPPTYGMYGVSAAVNDVEVKEVALTADFQPDVQAILKAANDRTKLLFICSPNNPTANCIDFNIIVELLSSFKGLVVVDEAYIDFCPEKSVIGLLKRYDNLFVMQTLSKAWGLAGVRIGLGIGHPDLIKVLDKVKPPYNISVLNAEAALSVLSNKTLMYQQVAVLINQRNRLADQLSVYSFVEKIYPSDANFLLVKVTQANLIYQKLINARIVVRNRSTVLLCNECLRITVGTPEENNKLLLALNTIEL
ncbi:MAG: histidinol-phosphate transaminase [Bacteroidetes bacterium]|nr:histidinol-phosphate transaminase [Bacteroidota bacterium]